MTKATPSPLATSKEADTEALEVDNSVEAEETTMDLVVVTTTDRVVVETTTTNGLDCLRKLWDASSLSESLKVSKIVSSRDSMMY